jgi:DNA repair ATPase RecN
MKVLDQNPLLKQALMRNNGAHFHKCALQVNLPDYLQNYRGLNSKGDPDLYFREILDECIKNEVTVLGIADHQCTGISRIREFSSNSITIFPGFEVASSEGVHVICLFPEDKTEPDLRHYLGALGITNSHQTRVKSDRRFVELVEKVQTELMGICIAAHVLSDDGGLLKVLTGDTRSEAWTLSNLLAVQIAGKKEELPRSAQGQTDFKKIILNNVGPNDSYYRKRPIACINARDIVSPEDISSADSCTYIKMTVPSIEGLKQAFQDPESRIRLESETREEPHSQIVTIAWEGGFLQNNCLHFNENLNCLIGGRGTGKSTIVETLRYALDKRPVGDDAQRQHNGIIKDVFGPGAVVYVLVRKFDKLTNQDRDYVIRRTYGDPPTVYDGNGQILPMKPSEMFEDVEIYGQHEISEIAKDITGEKSLRILDRFRQRKNELEQKKDTIRRALANNRFELLRALADSSNYDKALDRFPILSAQMELFKKQKVEDKLKLQTQLARESRIFEEFKNRLIPFEKGLDYLRSELPVDLQFLSDVSMGELPNRDVIGELRPLLESLQTKAKQVVSLVENELLIVKSREVEIKSKWQQRRDSASAEYEKVLRELHKEKIDANEFLRIENEMANLRGVEKQKKLVLERIGILRTKRLSLLDEWDRVLNEELRDLELSAKKINIELEEVIKVDINPRGNIEPLISFLEGLRLGLRKVPETIGKIDKLSVADLAARCRKSLESIKELGLPESYARVLFELLEDKKLELEEIELSHKPYFSLNIAARCNGPEWRDTRSLSSGQKATTILAVLLLESLAPLIIDQPEDDLDNRFIAETIVPKMRTSKQRRQFLLATHNANIPVFGDAELIVILEAGNNQASIRDINIGSIDAPPIQESAGRILEGGREAFEIRKQKYGY